MAALATFSTPAVKIGGGHVVAGASLDHRSASTTGSTCAALTWTRGHLRKGDDEGNGVVAS